MKKQEEQQQQKLFSSNVKYSMAPNVLDTGAAGDDGKKFNTKNRSLSHKLSAKVPARLVLYFLSWSGFLVSFMMRNDMHIAIVKMTKERNATVINSTTTTIAHNQTEGVAQALSSLDLNASSHSSNKTNTDFAQYLDWSSTVQSIVLSSFFWCYVLSQVVGGIATQYFGTKKVFGWSQFATACCSLLMPMGANMHYSIAIALRSIQGFASGLTWPAMYAVVGCWIPLAERSRFMSSFQGFSIGIGLTYVICGFLIEYCGWPYAFYTTGTLGMIWCIFWYLLAYNTPQEHPRVTQEEYAYIQNNISSDIKDSVGMKVPWKAIFCSMPAWSIGITTFGRIWIHYVFIVYGPKFMESALKFEYEANGILSGMPFICSYITSVLFCYIADILVQRDMMSLKNVRKTFTALSQIIPGILIFAIGYTEDIVVLLIIWFIAVSFITASYAGAMANIVDIAPNLAGPVLAFCQTIHMSASFLSPLISGLILDKGKSLEEWRIVFSLAAVITISTYFVYQIYGTADIQKWNYPTTPCKGEEDGNGHCRNGDLAKQGNAINDNDADDDDDDDNDYLNEGNKMLRTQKVKGDDGDNDSTIPKRF